jgi:hypothetical protein
MTAPREAPVSAAPRLGLTLWAGWVGLLVLLGLDLARAPSGAVDAETAAALDRTVAQVAGAPRPTGSAALAAVQDGLAEELRAAGFDVEEQVGEVMVERGGLLLGGRVRNLVARRAGVERRDTLLLVSHTDSVPNAAGAADAGAGVAAVLAAARAIGAGPPARNDVVVLLTDGEEAGLLGATLFQREHPRWSSVGAVLKCEGRGAGGAALMFHTGPGSGALVRALAELPHARAGSLGPAVFSLLPNDTDLSALFGVPGLDFAFVDGLRVYHSSEDRPERLDRRTLQHQAALARSLSLGLADADLSRPTGPAAAPATGTAADRWGGAADPVYFNLPGGLVVLDAVMMPILAVSAAVLWLLALLAARPRLGPLLFGLLSAPLSAVGAVGLCYGALSVLSALSPVEAAHEGMDSPLAAVLRPLLSLLGLWPALALSALGGRWAAGGGPTLGGGLAWVGLSLWVAFTLPGAAYPFVLPALGLSLGLVCLGLRARASRSPGLRWPRGLPEAGTALLSLPPALLLLVPLAALLGATLPLLAWGVGLSPLAMAVGPLLGLPGAASLTPGRRALPLLLGLVLLGLVGVALVEQAPDRWPQPYHLVHLTDERGPRWISGEARRAGWLAELVPDGAPAADASPDVMLFGGEAFEAPAPDADVLPPEVSVEAWLGDSVALRLRSRRGARALAFRPAPGSRVLSVEGAEGPHEVQGTGRARRLLWVDPPEAGLRVVLTLGRGTSVLVDETDGLPISAPPGWWSRPAPWSAVTLGRVTFEAPPARR